MKILNLWIYNNQCWEPFAKSCIRSYDSSLIFLQHKFTNFTLFLWKYGKQNSEVKNSTNISCLCKKLLQIFKVILKCLLRLLRFVVDKSCKRLTLFRRNHINPRRKCHGHRTCTAHNYTEQMSVLGLF